MGNLSDLSSLFVDTFELGFRKAERDVADEVCAAFGIDLSALEQKWSDRDDAQHGGLRAEVSEQLASRASSMEELLTVVIRSSADFLQMVREIYDRLASHRATTRGPSEEFRFRKDGEIIDDLPISPAFIERVRYLIRQIAQIELGEIDHKKVLSLLGPDGDFYGTWPPRRDRQESDVPTTALPRAITHLAWLKYELDNRARRDPSWRRAADALPGVMVAAERFIENAMLLVQAHIRLLGDDASDAESAEAETSDRRHLLEERRLLREERLLQSSIRPGNYRAGGNSNQWLYVRVDELLESRHTLGSAPGCLVAGDPTPDADGYVSIGTLACLCAIWKSGGKHPPTDDFRSLRQLLEQSDDADLTDWLGLLELHLEEAAQWLREEVWTPTGTVEKERIVEAFEEFLNLPLWRHRWLLYEIWAICAAIEAAEQHGWRCELHFESEKQREEEAEEEKDIWILPTDPSTDPIATLTLSHRDQIQACVYREPKRVYDSGELTPDVTISTSGDRPRDLVVIECKDRYRMRTEGEGSVLAIGQKYRDGLGAEVTWVVNYSEFADARLRSPDVNHGDGWRALHFAERFRPGVVPASFRRMLSSALLPASRRAAQPLVPKTLVFVLDTTGSMHSALDAIWSALMNSALSQRLYTEHVQYFAILFSDHHSPDPYVFKRLGPHETIAELHAAVKQQELGDGGDEPEALEDAMHECCELAGELNTPIVCVVFTDAPPHPADDCPEGFDFSDEVTRLLKAGNRCIVIRDLMIKTPLWWDFAENEPGFEWMGIDELERLADLVLDM